jgi:hypothetical protein
MMNILNWVKNNKVVTGLGVLALGGIALALTSKNEETEDVTTEALEAEVVTDVIDETK